MTVAERLDPTVDNRPATAATAIGIALGLVAVAVARLLLFGWAEVAPDDARYVFVGLSTLGGHGPLTPSGNVFLLRSPVYGVILAVGGLIGGNGPLDGARVVGASLTICGLLGAVRLGWLEGGLVAGLGTAVALLATPLLWNLLPTLRIDLPQTAGVLAVLLAMRRPTVSRWLLGGALLGLTVLVKETVLLLALVPLAFVSGIPWIRLGRLWAAYLAAAAVVAGWWWIVVWTQSGAVFPLNAIGVIENRDVAATARIDTFGLGLLGVFTCAWIVVGIRAVREPQLRVLIAAALALVPPTLYAALSGLNARNDAGLAVLSAVAVGVAAARIAEWPSLRRRIAARPGLAHVARVAGLATVAVAIGAAGIGQARVVAPREPALPALIAREIQADPPVDGQAVMTFRDAEIVAVLLYGKVGVPALAVVRVDPATPLDSDLWIGLRDQQLFAYSRASWSSLLGAAGTTDLVLAGPHPLTPVELLPSLDRGDLPGLVLSRRLAADGDWASIYRVDPGAVRAGAGDVPLHLSPAAALAWLDLAGGSGAAEATRRLAASGAIVVGAGVGVGILERRLAGAACLIPIPDLGPGAWRIEETATVCTGG